MRYSSPQQPGLSALLEGRLFRCPEALSAAFPANSGSGYIQRTSFG